MSCHRQRPKQPALTLVGGRAERRRPTQPAPVARADDVGSICLGCGEPLPRWINRVFCDACLADDDGPEAA